MYKYLVIANLMYAVGYVTAAPQQYTGQQYKAPVPIISQSQDGPNIDGSYSFSYQSGDGTAAQERGYVKNFGSGEPNELQSAEGSFSYTAPDGQAIQITYTADENGFLPQGAHIPTPPPIPPEIQRALEFIASQPQQDYDERGFPVGGQRNPPPRYG